MWGVQQGQQAQVSRGQSAARRMPAAWRAHPSTWTHLEDVDKRLAHAAVVLASAVGRATAARCRILEVHTHGGGQSCQRTCLRSRIVWRTASWSAGSHPLTARHHSDALPVGTVALAQRCWACITDPRRDRQKLIALVVGSPAGVRRARVVRPTTRSQDILAVWVCASLAYLGSSQLPVSPSACASCPAQSCQFQSGRSRSLAKDRTCPSTRPAQRKSAWCCAGVGKARGQGLV